MTLYLDRSHRQPRRLRKSAQPFSQAVWPRAACPRQGVRQGHLMTRDAFLCLAFTAATIGIAWTAWVSGWPVLWAAAALYAFGAMVAWADWWRA